MIFNYLLAWFDGFWLVGVAGIGLVILYWILASVAFDKDDIDTREFQITTVICSLFILFFASLIVLPSPETFKKVSDMFSTNPKKEIISENVPSSVDDGRIGGMCRRVGF